MPYKDPNKERANAIERGRKYRAKKHAERWGDTAGDMRGRHVRQPKPPREPMVLTAELAREWFEYDAQTGKLYAPVKRGKWESGRAIGCSKDGYINVSFDRVKYRAHRVIWLMVHGVWPSGLIDHINGDRADNRICNLRVVTRQENTQNMARPRRNKTGVMGVSRCERKRNPWFACISVNGKTLPLGRYRTIGEAQAAYLSARAKYYKLQPVPREALASGQVGSAA